jgi:nitric oxide reductase NorQ protein
MSIALLVESQTVEGKYQTVLVPTPSGIITFKRLSNGGRGRGQAWSNTPTPSLEISAVTIEPNAVVIDDTDIALARVGNITNLAGRLMSAGAVPLDEGMAHDIMVGDLVEKLYNGDDTLNQYLRDNRRKSGVSLKPIKELATAFIPMTATTTETEQDSFVSTTTRPQLELAKVPDKSWAERYLNRKVGKAKLLDFDLLDIAKEQKQNVLIRGHAGSGKTMCVLAWASARGYRYYNISANVGLEPSHLFGSWIPTEKAGVFKWQDGPVTDLVRNGGVLLLNEIDFIPERITTVLFGLLDDRREIQLLENGGEVIKAHADLVVIGDHNPSYRGSRPMNQAWKDRFAHKWEFDYDRSIEKKLIKSNSLLEVAKQLRDTYDKGEIETPISTRGLEMLVKNITNIGLEYAIETYINGFADDEKDAVELVFSTHLSNIGDDFGIVIKTVKQADEE